MSRYIGYDTIDYNDEKTEKPTRKLAASAFKYCDMKVIAASLQVGFCEDWKTALPNAVVSKQENRPFVILKKYTSC